MYSGKSLRNLKLTSLFAKKSTSLFAKKPAFLFAKIPTFLFAKKSTLLFTVYNKSLLPAASINNILESAICPPNSLDLSFDEFLNQRITKLIENVNKLIE